jgi:dTDP-4-amino-4,6-dideoxygalactose transaminase
VKIPYVNLASQHQNIKKELLQAVESVLDSGQFILGEETALFEKEFASLCGVEHAVGVNSGTDALILGMRCLGIGAGDEVITTSNSYLASASSIALAGAIVKFADVRNDLNIDPLSLEKAISPKTKAVVVVHLTGRPAPMDEVLDICKRHNLKIVEDAAQAVGAKYKGKPVGSFGDVGCFSLHPLKNLNACGDAGILVTKDKRIADRARLLRNHGHSSRDNCVEFSMVSRLDSLQAAILRVKLRHLDVVTSRRRENANFYFEKLRSCPYIRLPVDSPEEFSVYHTFVIQAERRNELKGFLEAQGMATAIHYPIPIHLMEVGRNLGFHPGMLPNTERLASVILSLPIYPELGKDELTFISEKILEFYN